MGIGFVTVIMSFIISRIPVVGKPFRVIYTIIHELGHVFATKITFGKVEKIKLNSDSTGSADVATRGKLGTIIVFLSGYTSASIISLLSVIMLKFGLHVLVIYIMIGIVGIGLLFWIRNGFGVMWALTFILVSIFVVNALGTEVTIIYVGFVVGILYVESMFVSFNLFRVIKSKQYSDARALRDETGIFEGFWAFVFVSIAVGSFLVGIMFW